MQKAVRFLPLLIIIFGLCVFAERIDAGSAQKKDATIEKKYSAGTIIVDFLDVAFSERFWNEDAEKKGEGGFAKVIDSYRVENWNLNDAKIKDMYDTQRRYLPWLADHVYRPDGLPAYGVIHKWDAALTIGIGWPAFSGQTRPEYDTAQGRSPFSESEAREFYEVAAKIVDELIPVIEETTGLSANLIAPTNAKETTEDYARIRIIPTTRKVSSRSWARVPSSEWMPQHSEVYLWGAIPFEVLNPKLIDGYILPKKTRGIELAVCKISTSASEELFKALVAECLVHALGLPARFQLQPELNSIFGDGFEGASSDDFVFDEIPEYDRRLISLLYCPAVKSGMDKNEVFQLLISDDRCINRYLQ